MASASNAAKIVKAHNNPKVLTDGTPLNPTIKNPHSKAMVVDTKAGPV